MAHEIVLPQWGMEMQDATIVRWLKHEGDSVSEGEPLVEIETAKIETEMESTAAGVLAHILVPEGTTVPIRTVLAIVAAAGEQVPRPLGVAPAVTAAPSAAPAPPPSAAAGSVQITPVARRLAQQHGIDLSRVQGSGPGGRVVREDVERAVAPQAEATARAAAVVSITGIRQTIATRMLQSVQTTAQVTLTTEVDVTDAMTLRAGLARQWADVGLSPLHLVIKAAARALKVHPRMNGLQKDRAVELLAEINVGVAVSLQEGLIVPTIRRADEKPLADIASESRDLAKKAREGTISYDEVTGGTFTVTNLGAYGIDAFTPIINAPQIGILGVGRVVDKPVVYQGEITKRSMMFLSLTFDHRVIDGAPAAEFLCTVKEYLEDPWWMVAALLSPPRPQ
jgi:pyruvate dehydrogenase E2 component (dihydrolipoamide acetyltransferase)